MHEEHPMLSTLRYMQDERERKVRESVESPSPGLVTSLMYDPQSLYGRMTPIQPRTAQDALAGLKQHFGG